MERMEIGSKVERKKLNQWFFNITKFSEELLENLENLDEWPNKVKVMQKLIGTFGCEVKFDIENSEKIKNIKCFTTRPDTLFGLSFLAIPIDHPISEYYEYNKEFIKFKKKCSETGTTKNQLPMQKKLDLKRS